MTYIILFSAFLFLIIIVLFFFTYKLSSSRDNSSNKQLLENFTPEDSKQGLHDMVTHFKSREIINYDL